MSSVKAETYDMVFKVRAASFYELLPAGREALLRDFSEFIEAKGKEHRFLVWRTVLECQDEN
jgi:hypothetical protein